MWTPERILTTTRARLADLVAIERKACGCACTAIKAVARRIGSSPAWIRKITGRYGEASVHAHLFLNIKAEHRKRFNLKAGAARVIGGVKRKFRAPQPAYASLEN